MCSTTNSLPGIMPTAGPVGLSVDLITPSAATT
jgi:hypothetical protein